MKVAWLVICVIVMVGPGKAQDKAAAGDFTKSPNEHIINQLDRPIVVRSMQGVVSRKEGYHEPLPNVLFESKVLAQARRSGALLPTNTVVSR
jgi:hypothetical protein